VRSADEQTLIGERLALRAQYERSADRVEILMGATAEERNPYTGAPMRLRLPVRTPEMMYEYGTFQASETGTVPAAYVLLETSPQVMANLDAHGVRYRVLDAAADMAVERFRMDSTTVAPREFQGHRERTVFGRWEAERVNVPAGAVVIDMNQPLARLLFTLLEPRSDDGLVNWNYFDRWIEAGGLPIARLVAGT
jgi:hypothetical protein